MPINFEQARHIAGLMHRRDHLSGWLETVEADLVAGKPFTLENKFTLVLDDAKAVRLAVRKVLVEQITAVDAELGGLGVSDAPAAELKAQEG